MEATEFAAAFGATASAAVNTLTADDAHLAAVQELALELMARHGLRPGEPGGWTLQWDRAEVRAGGCAISQRVISLSAPLLALWPMAECRDIILHEIAHALTPHLWSGQYHGAEWQCVCLRIGANPVRCYDAEGERPAPPAPYTGYCPAGHVFTRRRKTRGNLPRISCHKCAPRYDERYLITWTQT
jgi:predicted SprT family Zn-dependent metalloprotease